MRRKNTGLQPDVMPATYDVESLLDDVLDYGAGGKSGLAMVQASVAYARDVRVSAPVYIYETEPKPWL
ncbi:MAG TPA: hypothetical protein VMX13_00280 [Sedimentisphaerales bacterium]|nr:hypothetical protein [Sedimentisphaerales bacterium]